MSRKRFFLIGGVALLLLAIAGLWQWRLREQDGRAAYARGIAALDKGDARTARVELMNAIKGEPRSVAARLAQARALVELGDGAGAQAEVERMRALGGRPGEARDVMAQALLLQGDMEGALREAAMGDTPGAAIPATLRVAARAHMARGDLDAARAALEKALPLAPSSADTWTDISRLRLMLGDQAGAIGAADRALALAPTDADALTLRGTLVRDQYGLVAALPWFERALAIYPDSIAALTEYAATLADAGQASRALGISRRVLAVDPANARAWFLQAVIAARADKADLARGLLARTGGRLDNEPSTLLLRGILHIQDGNGVLAAQSLGQLVQAQPDNRVARTLLARALFMTGDYASAATMLAPIVAQRDADPYVLTLAARTQEALGDRAMADDMLARAAWPVRAVADPFIDPRDSAITAGPPPANAATAQDNIPYIRALLATGRADAAVARAQMLSRANPGAPAAHVVLGDALGAAGRPADAVRAYETAANIRFDRNVALRLVAALGRAGDPTRAVQVVQLFLTQNPDDVAAMRLAAGAHMQAHDWRGALRLLQAVRARTGSQDAVLMSDMARAALESGDAARARAYAAHAYRMMPGNPMTADIYGWTLMRSGQAGQPAIDLLEKAVALAPRHPLIQMHLGQAYAAAGRKREAKLALNRALSVGNFAERQQAVDALAAL